MASILSRPQCVNARLVRPLLLCLTYQLPVWQRVVSDESVQSSAPFHKRFSYLNSNSTEISIQSHLDSNTAIATNFCTWHDSCAVVACANICCDLMASNGITARQRFHRIWIAGTKSTVKRGPGLTRSNPHTGLYLSRIHGCHSPHWSAWLSLIKKHMAYRDISDAIAFSRVVPGVLKNSWSINLTQRKIFMLLFTHTFIWFIDIQLSFQMYHL